MGRAIDRYQAEHEAKGQKAKPSAGMTILAIFGMFLGGGFVLSVFNPDGFWLAKLILCPLGGAIVWKSWEILRK